MVNLPKAEEASKHTQLIVATHSDRLIRFLEPHEVLICDLEEGEAKMTWADNLDLNFVLTKSSQNERITSQRQVN